MPSYCSHFRKDCLGISPSILLCDVREKKISFSLFSRASKLLADGTSWLFLQGAISQSEGFASEGPLFTALALHCRLPSPSTLFVPGLALV